MKNFMLKINVFLAVVFLFLLTNTNYIKAQSIQSLENKLLKLQNNYDKQTGSLDSLKNVLNKSVKEIDAEKRKTKIDENKIKNLMAASVTISNQINDRQKATDKISAELEATKKLLDQKYTSIIDSLSRLENSNKFKGNKEELRAQILKLTEKKILMSPSVFSLSFNPGKIIAIDPSKAKSNDEKNIYKEYLKGALNEVDNQLQQITKLNKEVKQMITLREKTSKFLEQAEFSSDIASRSLSVKESGNSEDITPSSLLNGEKANTLPQIQSFSFLLNQLNITKETGDSDKERFSLDSLRTNLTIDEYEDLLNEIINKLSDYKLILSHKLDFYK